jgi:hypothetical protein
MGMLQEIWAFFVNQVVRFAGINWGHLYIAPYLTINVFVNIIPFRDIPYPVQQLDILDLSVPKADSNPGKLFQCI